jgi:pimeloyl-ACP methyl ester carboxylesterase
MKYLSAIILFVLAVGYLMPIATPAQQAKSGEIIFEPYLFEATGQKVEAELGRLQVPENRRKPRGHMIEITFVRFKSTAKHPGSPIIYLAGGPGGSGIASARGARFPLFMAMREFGDVIALDQRGVGRSKPNLSCRETYSMPLDMPPTREEVVRITRERSRSCAEYWRQQGVDLSGYNTNENADDIEALRKALGAKKVSLWGISYGTTLALATIKRHGQNIDKVIMAGVEGLDSVLKPPSEVDKHLAEIDRLVREDARLNKQIPDFLLLIKSVLDRLEKEPVTVEVTDPRTKEKVKVVINKYAMQLLTAAAIGTDALVAFPRLYVAASKGDFSEIAPQWVNLSKSSIGSAMAYMTDCASGASVERRRRIQREAKDALLGNAADIVFPDVCDAWYSPDLGKSFRSPVRSNLPVLFISGTLDGRTPVSSAEEVRKSFRNSHHLIIEGAWHSDPLFLSSPKILDVMLEFMRGVPLSKTRITLPPPRFAPLKQ